MSRRSFLQISAGVAGYLYYTSDDEAPPVSVSVRWISASGTLFRSTRPTKSDGAMR